MWTSTINGGVHLKKHIYTLWLFSSLLLKPWPFSSLIYPWIWYNLKVIFHSYVRLEGTQEAGSGDRLLWHYWGILKEDGLTRMWVSSSNIRMFLVGFFSNFKNNRRSECLLFSNIWNINVRKSLHVIQGGFFNISGGAFRSVPNACEEQLKKSLSSTRYVIISSHVGINWFFFTAFSSRKWKGKQKQGGAPVRNR